MSREDRLSAATRLAYALLRQSGSLSLAEIEALPFIEDSHEALAVANRLLQAGQGIEESEQARSGVLTRRDQVLSLR